MRHRKTKRSHSGESGYMLLAVMLAFALILIALAVEAPRLAQQIKREKEEELVHRGKDYATAIKRYVHKNGGRFPLSLEQLEDTNHVRFLRKRYKDPITGESDWRLVRFGEAQVNIPAPKSTLPTSPLPGSIINPPPPPLGSTGTLTTSPIGNGQTIGGGPIIGVASVSKGQAIKEFNEKDHYDEWLFVYDLRLEQSGGTGVTVAAPRSASSTGTNGPPPTASPTPVLTPTPPPN